ncbi:hypothetical protein C8Q76DRAFT_342210 [Earliella scabrosa]|nr:hypothetical protein C8Q76DRAFT_342210 [Earliella scabrosa]
MSSETVIEGPRGAFVDSRNHGLDRAACFQGAYRCIHRSSHDTRPPTQGELRRNVLTRYCKYTNSASSGRSTVLWTGATVLSRSYRGEEEEGATVPIVSKRSVTPNSEGSDMTGAPPLARAACTLSARTLQPRTVARAGHHRFPPDFAGFPARIEGGGNPIPTGRATVPARQSTVLRAGLQS